MHSGATQPRSPSLEKGADDATEILGNLFLASALLSVTTIMAGDERLSYPKTLRVKQVDDYHGTKVADPYRWLEDDVRKSQGRRRLGRRAEQGHVRLSRTRFPSARRSRSGSPSCGTTRRYSAPSKARRPLLLHQERRPAEPVRALHAGSLDGEPRVLLDPNTWSKDGTVALAGTGGQRRRQVPGLRRRRGRLRLADLAGPATSPPARSARRRAEVGQVQRRLLDARTARASSTAASTSRSRARSSRASTLNQKLYYHRLGTPQSDDVLVYQPARPARLGLRRRRHRRRPLPDHHRLRTAPIASTASLYKDLQRAVRACRST